MGLNHKKDLNQCRITWASSFRGVQKVGQQLEAVIEAKISATIMCRGIFAVLRGYEQVCWKKTDTPNQSNAVRREIIKHEILVHGDPEKGGGEPLPPGMHSFPVRFVLPDDLPSSFTLPQNPHTGIFYTLCAEFRTITRLSSRQVPFDVEGVIHTRPLELDCRVARKSRKSLIKGGVMRMEATLHRSMLVAGDTLRIDVEVENGSQRLIEYLQITLKQQLTLLYNAKKGKRFDSCERVYLERDDSIKSVAAPGTFKRTLAFKIPERLPTTQSTPKGTITIEYHVNVRVHIPWAIDMRVRLPLLVLEQTRFPELLSPLDKERHENAVAQDDPNLVSAAAAAAANYGVAPPPKELGADAADNVYTPAPARPAGGAAAAPSYGSVPAGSSAASASAAAAGEYGNVPGASRKAAAPSQSVPAVTVTQSPTLDPKRTSKKQAASKSAPSPKLQRNRYDSEFDVIDEVEENDDMLSPAAAGAAGADIDEELDPVVAAAALLGYHSEADVAAYNRAISYFEFFDKNNDGVIDRKEFAALHHDLVKNKITDKSEEDAWWQIDADHDESITRNEYCDFLISVGSLRPPASPTTSRRGSFSFHIESYPYEMCGDEAKYGAVVSGRRPSTTAGVEAKPTKD